MNFAGPPRKGWGNRRATCRNYCAHPAIVESYMSGSLLNAIKRFTNESDTDNQRLHPEEMCVLRLLECRTIIVKAA